MDEDEVKRTRVQDNDEMRQKRLARLAAMNSPRGGAPDPTTSPSTLSRMDVDASTVTPTLHKHVHHDTESPVMSTPKPQSSSATSPALTLFINQSSKEWENTALSAIFQLTLDPTLIPTKSYLVLEDVAQELKQEGQEMYFTSAIKERVLYSRLSLESNREASSLPLFDYLVACWKRCVDIHRKIQSLSTAAENITELVNTRCALLKETQALIVSYSGLVITPGVMDTFVQPEAKLQAGPKYLCNYLLHPDPSESEQCLPRAFLDDFILRFQGDELKELLVPILNGISAAMRDTNLSRAWQTPFRALNVLLSYKWIASHMTAMSNFHPPHLTAKTIEVLTLLGPFFSKTSPFCDVDSTLADAFFPPNDMFGASGAEHELRGAPIGARNPGDVLSAMESLYTVSCNVSSQLYGIVMTLIKADAHSKEGVLQYLADAIVKNKARGKMQVDRTQVSSEGFMLNILNVLLRLCEPVMDPTWSKLHLIDVNYFQYSNRLGSFAEDTLMNADKDTYEKYATEFKASHPTTAANFVSDIFYMCLAGHHYGFNSTLGLYENIGKDVEELKKHVMKLKQDHEAGRLQGPHAVMASTLMKRFEGQLDRLISTRLSLESILLNHQTLTNSVRFYNLVIVWLMRVLLVAHGQINLQEKQPDAVLWTRLSRGELSSQVGITNVTFSDSVPLLWATLPEWILEDVCEFYLFLCRHKPTYFEQFARDEFLTLAMIVLRNPQLIKNPYLKSKFVEILFFFTLPLYQTRTGETLGRLDGVFVTHPLCKQYLVPNIMRFYVDVEQTGTHSQFYDKFNIRYNISQVMKSVWTDIQHRQQLMTLSRDLDFFVKFVNLLMNDTTYLLDEGLTKLIDIKNLQLEMADAEGWNAKTPEYRKEKEQLLYTLERQAQSYVSLGNETVHMLNYLTAEPNIIQPFMESYIVDRLAAMMDYNLVALVGERCMELKVQNPEKYRFNPKKLLTELVSIYINLSHRSEFVHAVARDQRSYRKDIFIRAMDVLRRNGLLAAGPLDQLLAFVNQVEESVKQDHMEEEAYGDDIPDEYLDPLMYTLMEDPVLLPTSKNVVDRSTIKQHLLSDPHDPFNRMPLTMDMLVPDTALRQAIEQWKQSKKSKI